jgi:protein required for attachment to host cells
MLRQLKTWVIAADDISAHIFERRDGHLKPVSDLQPQEDTETEMTNRTLGRTGSSPTERHKYEPSMAQGRQHESAFAHQIAILLNDAAARQAFDKLVMVAPPGMLGLLRAELSDQARRHVAAEVDKEFSNLPPPELQERLMGILRDPDIMSGGFGQH